MLQTVYFVTKWLTQWYNIIFRYETLRSLVYQSYDYKLYYSYTACSLTWCFCYYSVTYLLCTLKCSFLVSAASRTPSIVMFLASLRQCVAQLSVYDGSTVDSVTRTNPEAFTVKCPIEPRRQQQRHGYKNDSSRCPYKICRK